ncbi:ABC transporter permease subunit [Bacillus sp. FJAT-27445]|uniref:ABC transporter permease subunit n=1 Tax=Bacillus sp. FJAT-27445 TaxID=1679166 RepID=UPI000744110F|nr:ABC transporter permease subunit [Bacillus sp. FJAT-27445]
MNKAIVMAIAKKDLKAAFTSKKVWVPMSILAVMLCVLLPTAFAALGLHTNLLAADAKDIEKPINAFIEKFPDGEMGEKLASLPDLGSKFVYFFMSFMMIPFFLLVAIINSSVTASNSFAGEKERKTLETLLFAPISIKDLFIGKVIASLVPALGITFAAYFIDIVVINVITYPYFGELLFVKSVWLLLIFWVTPALVLFNIALNVLISAKVKTFQEAQQLGGLMVLPIILILVSQATGLFFVSPLVLVLIGAFLLAANVVLLKGIMKFNQRNALFESQIH